MALEFLFPSKNTFEALGARLVSDWDEIFKRINSESYVRKF